MIDESQMESSQDKDGEISVKIYGKDEEDESAGEDEDYK